MSELSNYPPLVSIILPTYNRALCIDRAVSSVICQTLTDWELIIIDNNSTDNTVKLIDNFTDERISITKIENNGIVASSRNLGIKLASGTFVAFLDSDDWWVPEKLEIAVSALQDGHDVVYHDLYMITRLPAKKKSYSLVRTRPLTTPVFNDLLTNGNALSNSSVVVRSDLLSKINSFSEKSELVGSEDFDGWLRMAQFSDRFHRLDGVLGCYWHGSGNLSSSKSALSNIKALQDIYAIELSELSPNKLPGWMIYSLARNSVAQGKFHEGRKYAWLALNCNISKFLKGKVLIIWLMALLKVSR